MKLSPEIDESFLCENPPKVRDQQILGSSIEMKSKYEEKFTSTFLNMEKGCEIEVYGLTFFCPQSNDSSGGTVLTMVLNRIEFEMIENEEQEQEENEYKKSKIKITAIILNRPPDEKQDTSEEFRFSQKVLTEFGRFGNVRLWCIENAGIISQDDLHTYAIFSSDLFL